MSGLSSIPFNSPAFSLSLPTSSPSYCRPATCTLKAGEGTHFFFSRSNQRRSVRPGSRWLT